MPFPEQSPREFADQLERAQMMQTQQTPFGQAQQGVFGGIQPIGKQFLNSVVANALHGPTQIAGVTKLPRANPGDFTESMPGGSQIPGGSGWYNEDYPGKYDKDFPSPFGEDMFPRAAVPAALGYVG